MAVLFSVLDGFSSVDQLYDAGSYNSLLTVPTVCVPL